MDEVTGSKNIIFLIRKRKKIVEMRKKRLASLRFIKNISSKDYQINLMFPLFLIPFAVYITIHNLFPTIYLESAGGMCMQM